MNWTMPRPVLQWVAAVIGLLSLGSFVLGVATAPPRSRLPGEREGGQAGQPLQAVDATPLGEERIEGPSPPPELSDEEKAKLAEEKEAREAASAAKAQAEQSAASPTIPAAPAPAPDAAAPAPASPKAEEPPF